MKAYKFAGADYVPERDNPRLTGQLLRIWDVVKSGRWKTLAEISAKTGDPEASISAQLRHLRKPRFGGYEVEREIVKDGLYRYRVLPNTGGKPSLEPRRRTKRKWVGLTDEEIRKIEYSDDKVEYELFDEGEYGYEINIYPRKFARAIEAKLKEKNVPQP